MTPRHTSWFPRLMLAVIAAACADSSTMTSKDNSRPSTSFEVVVNPAVYARDDVPSRTRKRDDAVRAILERTPERMREGMRETLDQIESPSVAIALRHSDPETAKLLGIVQSIAAANHLDRARERQRAKPAGGRPTQAPQIIAVRIALVEKLSPAKVKARVIRRRDDNGVPIVLLRESDVTVADVRTAMHFARLSYLKHGKVPARNVKTDYTAKPVELPVIDVARVASLERDLAWLRAQPPKDIPGVGAARAMEYATPLNQSPPPKTRP